MTAAPQPPSEEVARRLCYIMHCAWIEARNAADDRSRIFDLADTMEYVALLLRNYTEPYISIAREELAKYRAKYAGHYDYRDMFDNGVPEDGSWLWLSRNTL